MRHKPRPHAAFFVFPEFADTIPTLSVVSTLIRRGWRVSYVTTERFSGHVQKLGAEFIRCPSYREFMGVSPEESIGKEHANTAATLSAVSEYYEANRPTVVIHDTVSYAGRVVAKLWDIPSVQVSCDFRMNKGYPSRHAPDFFNSVLQASPSFQRILGHYGLVGDGFCFARCGLEIYFYPRLFQLDGNGYSESSFYAGRCAPERPHSDKWRPRSASQQPIVLVSSSSLFLQGPEYFKMCIDAMSSLPWHVVLNIGENNIPDALGELPNNFEIARRRPLIAMLPHVDLLICAGGMMTTVESLYCGVPMLTMTHGNVELEAYAENGVRLGVGRHLRGRDTSARTIRDTLMEMSEDTELFNTVEQVQRLVQAEPGAEEVANRISGYVATNA